MSRGFPSMTALLGLLAIAGYQNRDKLAEMLGSGQQGGGQGASVPDRSGAQPGGAAGQQGGLRDLLGNLGPAGAGGLLSGGLAELVESFRRNGQGDVADSWVGTGPNRDLAPRELEQAIGPDVLATLSRQTGLPRDEILARLSRDLPHAVDRYTPEGRLPT